MIDAKKKLEQNNIFSQVMAKFTFLIKRLANQPSLIFSALE